MTTLFSHVSFARIARVRHGKIPSPRFHSAAALLNWQWDASVVHRACGVRISAPPFPLGVGGWLGQSLKKYFESKDSQITMRLEHVAFNLNNLQKLEDEISKKKQEIKNNIYMTCGGVQELIELRQNELLKEVRALTVAKDSLSQNSVIIGLTPP